MNKLVTMVFAVSSLAAAAGSAAAQRAPITLPGPVKGCTTNLNWTKTDSFDKSVTLGGVGISGGVGLTFTAVADCTKTQVTASGDAHAKGLGITVKPMTASVTLTATNAGQNTIHYDVKVLGYQIAPPDVTQTAQLSVNKYYGYSLASDRPDDGVTAIPTSGSWSYEPDWADAAFNINYDLVFDVFANMNLTANATGITTGMLSGATVNASVNADAMATIPGVGDVEASADGFIDVVHYFDGGHVKIASAGTAEIGNSLTLDQTAGGGLIFDFGIKKLNAFKIDPKSYSNSFSETKSF